MRRALRLAGTRRPSGVALDVVLGGVLAVSAVLTELGSRTAPAPWAAVLAGAWMACLALRSSAPTAMAVGASTGALVYGSLPGVPETPFWAFLAVLVVAFSLGTRVEGPRRWAAGLLLLVAAMTLSYRSSTERDPADLYVSPAAIVCAPLAAGVLLQRSRRQAAELRRVGRELLAEREAHARDAAAEERNRIARELHDVISHSVSVMVVQAGAAEQRLPAGSPVRAQVQAIRSTGRGALEELRQQLGVLREAPTVPVTTAPGQAPGQVPAPPPMPTLADVAELVRGSGAALDLDPLEAADVPPGTGLAAFRVVQEALTNARKHAAGAPVRVRVTVVDDLSVEVVNGPGGTLEGAPGGGHGLSGMRERVELYAGQLDVGPTAEGGWRVRARLPLPVTSPTAGLPA